MYKKVRCKGKVVVLPTKSIVVLDVLVAVASSDRKVPIHNTNNPGHNQIWICNFLRCDWSIPQPKH